ncbi:hypothetical protein BGZ97_008340 [Linnemannia gamsii]|uniref:AAA+ ATPase domain-containing protein n=1 Tax=Linnemannia gamsii TaxID=64522 RepID=A0A9P6RPT0_9FUNG|nr:hypothetical protein BGZ97_008340 [Linnemannia gamsii]
MSSTQKVVLLVGPPGSGKSTFAKALTKVFPNFVRINQDDLGDRQACEELTMSALQAKNRTQSVVIDRCNFDQDQRKVWINIARQLSISEIDVIIMDTEFYHCKKRILARSNHPTQVEGAQGVDILYKFMEMLTLPTYFEGFTRIMRLEPQPTEEYSEEAVKEIMDRLSKVEKPENLQAPRWQKEDYYFKTQYHRDEEAYRARKAAQYAASQQGQKPAGGHKAGLEVDEEGFAIKKRPGHKDDSQPSAPAPVRPPLFGGVNGGWRAREAAKKQQQEQQEPKKFGPTLYEVPKPAVTNPFDLLGDDE